MVVPVTKIFKHPYTAIKSDFLSINGKNYFVHIQYIVHLGFRFPTEKGKVQGNIEISLCVNNVPAVDDSVVAPVTERKIK